MFDSFNTFSLLIKFFASRVTHVSLPWLFVTVIALKVKSQTFSNERACFNTTILKIFYSETMINDRDVSLG